MVTEQTGNKENRVLGDNQLNRFLRAGSHAIALLFGGVSFSLLPGFFF
jgi:hypothetical protein